MPSFLLNTHLAVLSHLGLQVSRPDLDNSRQSLYNKAYRQAALKPFCQAAAGGVYGYMKIKKRYTKDLKLLIPAYNHYIHFLQKARYEREKKTRKVTCQ
ncbi:hypothetical protein VP01_1574g3 [Puccinia sorghi]|uniref:Uncharacterized protein n=1 Tax=Puccinia sorghi TaxID=27349 RepID=A0A0L6VIB0_9BASI|nr:hypothetical protein VP01_1574g3 [Puccinia sorghi]